MKQRFRIWKPKGNLKIKYKDENLNIKFWEQNAKELLSNIQGVAEKYRKQKIKLTNRQFYYQLVAAALIPNAMEIYKRICKFLTDMRYAGLLDWNIIEDRGRVPKKHAEWNSVIDLIESAVYSYRLPRWNGQKYYVELYCEKEAMESILKPIADKYHIYFGYNKGYSSASAIYGIAERVTKQINKGKEVILLYLGDHDPSGLDMIRDVKERIHEFLTKGIWYTEPNFDVIQVALTVIAGTLFKISPF